jgi:hypothetical protein
MELVLERGHGLRVKETVSRHGIVLNDMSATEKYCLGEGKILLTGEALTLERRVDAKGIPTFVEYIEAQFSG